MPFDIRQVSRPKGRTTRLQFRVTVESEIVFDSTWVAVRFSTVHEAEWLAATIDRLAQIGKFAGCPGHRNEVIPVFQFYDSFDTNHGKTVAGIMCHAEYLDGPYRGGCWYCQVVSGGTQFFHTAETAITPRSGLAAMWLCEVVISAVLSDVWQRGPTHCWQDSH